MLDFSCPQCGRQFHVGEEYAGRHVRCSSCGHAFHAPAATEGPPPIPPDAPREQTWPEQQMGQTPASAGYDNAAPGASAGNANAYPNPYASPQSQYGPAPSAPPYGSPYGYGGPALKPGAVTFYQVYCGLMMAMYAIVAALGVFILVMAGQQPNNPDAAQMQVVGAIYIPLGIAFAIAFLVPFFLKPSKGSWIYGIITIALGLLSCICWPFSIPLLIFWLQDPTKRYFGV